MTDKKPDFRRLEHAATILMELLPGQARDLVIELADLQYKCPRWHIVVGSMLRLFEEGRNSDYSTEPHWAHDMHEPVKTTCEECEKEFLPERLGQIYCSQTCGEASTRTDEPEPEIVIPESSTSTDSTDGSSDTPASPTGESSLQEMLRESADEALKEIRTL